MAESDSTFNEAHYFSPEREKYLKQLIQDNFIIYPEGVVEIQSVDEFNDLVTQWKSNLLVITVSSPTCPACKAFAPIFERAQKEFSPKGIIFARFDATRLPEIAQQFGIMGTPTTLFIQKKKVLGMQPGLIPPDALRMLINRLSKGNADVDNLYM